MKIFKESIVLVTVLVLLIAGCKKSTPERAIERGTVTDIQGNVYETVKIGEQWWMAENLKVKVFNDSSSILNIAAEVNDTIWARNTKPAYCALDERSGERYGNLYNYEALSNSKGLAPKGWHIPSDKEWMDLEKYIGLSEDQLEKTGWRGTAQSAALLPKNSAGWPAGDNQVFGTNTFGFSALPGGCRLFNGTKGEVTITGYWWTSSSKSANEAYYRNIHASHGEVFRYFTDKRYGFSVRCVKNN